MTRRRNMSRPKMAFAVLALLAGACAQRGTGASTSGSMGVFDADYVEELTGRVSRIAQVSSPAWGTSLYLVLDTEAGPLEVRVGPAWYVEQQEFTLSPGDTIRVAGSRVSANGGTALIAAELYKGDQMLVLRDDDGRPLWPASRK